MGYGTAAWYQSIHKYGYAWGICLGEKLVRKIALEIATIEGNRITNLPNECVVVQLIAAATFCLYLHERFHHRVESFAIRTQIVDGRPCYLPYMRSVYRFAKLTDDLIEEALAEAESIREISNMGRFRDALHPIVLKSTIEYLKKAIPLGPPGYRRGLSYTQDKKMESGLGFLWSQMRGLSPKPTQPSDEWVLLGRIHDALLECRHDIWIVKNGRHSVFPLEDSQPTCSSDDLKELLLRHGYHTISEPNDPIQRLKKNKKEVDIHPGYKRVPHGVLKNVLRAVANDPHLERELHDLAGI